MEKEKVIQQLVLSMRKNGDMGLKAVTCNHKKLKLGEYQYLKDKVEDMERKVNVVVDEVGGKEVNVCKRLDMVEQQLVRYNANRLSQCKGKLQEILLKMTEKLQLVEKTLFQSLQNDRNKMDQSVKQIQFIVSELKEQIKQCNNK